MRAVENHPKISLLELRNLDLREENQKTRFETLQPKTHLNMRFPIRLKNVVFAKVVQNLPLFSTFPDLQSTGVFKK